MAGHSKWSTIKRAKGKADAARGKLFNRLIREITIAAREGGGDATANPRLRTAIAAARGSNMPSKNIDSAVLKGSGQLEGVSYEEITFEGYGPNGVPILIETVSDSRNRIVAEVRHLLTKHGGNLGQTNSVAYLFKAKGVITVAKDAIGEDELMELALEAGADDVFVDDEEYEISTSVDAFEAVREALINAKLEPTTAELTKEVDNPVMLTEENAAKVIKLVDALDDLDDAQHVYAGFDLT
ncbi:MAG: YebC/PmpR family DNA-binding transcriptional regulator [Chitinispirillales bacterium]|jgi:YebC/PmpR family DNA-binding regulatory protein|nr:YebC/PmpR family DNA-binding transcriptional regulator [Chitinispirillales bacterium]